MRENLKKYKYAGGDRGIMYIYFYNPVASYLVNFLPKSLAPNSITLFGFIFSVLPCVLIFYLFGTSFVNPND
jgi:ethanolaminephosphotransferase